MEGKLINTVAQKCNTFLQITTFFYKSQLFSTNHNFFLQSTTFFPNIATFFYKPQLFSPILRLFSKNHNFFPQTTTFFYKVQLFSQYCDFFLQTTTFFDNIASAESRSMRRASHQPILMGSLIFIAVAGSMVVVAPNSHRGNPSLAPRGVKYFLHCCHEISV